MPHVGWEECQHALLRCHDPAWREVEARFNRRHAELQASRRTLTGDVRGQVNFGFDRPTGLAIAGAMMYEEIADFSEMALSALCELSNMISGNATIGISAAGIKCDITPPTILMGASVRASWFGMRSVTVPLQLPCGIVHVTVGIRID